MTDIYAFLEQNDITYQRFDHEAVFTCEESSKLPDMPGADTKNLFLRDKKGKRHMIVSVGHEKKVDLKALGKQLDISQNISFASPERLLKHLGVTPGAVTLLGVVNDPDHLVEVYIDKDLWEADALRVHPLVNTASLIIEHDNMERFFAATGHKVNVIDVPGS